jgi:hypothetical protein
MIKDYIFDIKFKYGPVTFMLFLHPCSWVDLLFAALWGISAPLRWPSTGPHVPKLGCEIFGNFSLQMLSVQYVKC